MPSAWLQLANKLNTAVKGQERGSLDIYVQVNTSGEESKFGVEPQDCVSLAEHVHKECDLLRFAGLMTIGQQDYTSRPEDFQVQTTWCKPRYKLPGANMSGRFPNLIICSHWSIGCGSNHISAATLFAQSAGFTACKRHMALLLLLHVASFAFSRRMFGC